MESPEWTDEDRALLLALAQYENTLCPGCGNPKQTAWHSHMSGWWKTRRYVCLACTSRTEVDGKAEEQVYSHTFIDPTVTDVDELPPLQLGVNTASPSEGGGS